MAGDEGADLKKILGELAENALPANITAELDEWAGHSETFILYEGFGLPVVEAMLSKTPVITSNVSSLPEAGGPDSLYIDPRDPEALTDAINKILDDSDLRERMIKSGYEYAMQKFNAKQTTHQVMDCYLSTLKG